MSSLFGQVWLWSLLSFVAGVALTWLVLVRPAKKELEDLEERLLTSPRPAPSSAPKAARDEFDSWHVEASRSLSDVQPVVTEQPRFDAEQPRFDQPEPVEHSREDPPRYDVANMKLDKRDELLEELDDEHRPLSDFEESHDFPEFEEERPRSLFDRLGSGADTHETLEPKPRPHDQPVQAQSVQAQSVQAQPATRVVPQPFPRAERSRPDDEPELPAEETNLLPAVPAAPVAEVAPRREEPTAPPEVQAFHPREVWRDEPVREVYQDEVTEGREEEDEPERRAAEETALIPATALAEAIAEVDRGESREEPQVWPEHDLTGHFQPVNVPEEGPRTEVMRPVRPETTEPVTTTLPEVRDEDDEPRNGALTPFADDRADAGRGDPGRTGAGWGDAGRAEEDRSSGGRTLADHQLADEQFFAHLQGGGDRHSTERPAVEPAAEQPTTEQPTTEQPVVESPAVERPAVERFAVERSAFEPPAPERSAFEPPAPERSAFEPPAFEPPVAEQPPAVEQTAVTHAAVERPAVERPRAERPAVEHPVAEPPAAVEQTAEVPFEPTFVESAEPLVRPARPEPEPVAAEPEPRVDVPFEPTFVDSGEPLVVRSAEPEPAPAPAPKKDGPVRPRSLFEPLVTTDDELPETTRPTPPPTPGGDQPFVPTLAPELLAATNQQSTNPAGLPQRPTRQSGERRSTPPPLSAPKPAAPTPPRPVRPRPVGFSPSTGGRPAPSAGSTRYRDQEEGFNPRSPFGPGSVLPKSDGMAPAPEFQVKATLTGRRYFTNGSANFRETRADVWFRTTSDAEKAGFREAP
ncbi:sunset domain-containing protein [Saccharothrix sp. Mg75]|uniref:sunset domain-containing protein n=1 Tax=Saccharothrix sp. Mg75 TaxID=3445357 RepID=UPI003EEB3739